MSFKKIGMSVVLPVNGVYRVCQVGVAVGDARHRCGRTTVTRTRSAPYLKTLKCDGSLVIVGLPGALEPAVDTVPLVVGRRSVADSVIGGVAETPEMRDFCAAHSIACDIEVIPIQAINDAYERMLRSDVRYRFVIDMASLNQEA